MASKLAGGRAGDGAMVAAFDYLFNECAHTRMCGTGPGGYDSSDTPSGQLLRHIDASSGCVATSAGGPAICFGIGGIAAAGRAIVIGEGMEAIKAAALALRGEGVGAKWYQAWGKNFPEGRLITAEEREVALARNARWIEAKIRAGYKIYDIGIDATRATRSPFYELERAALPPFKWAGDDIGRRHRLGGRPDFIQSPNFPKCSCGKDMTFYAQLDSINDEFVLADCGMIYVFVCFDCFETKSVLQSY